MESEEMFNNLCEIAKMISETFGYHCETVIHDCEHYEDFIAAIYNGHVSGRKKGDCVYITGDPVPETTGGKTIKSSTVYFKSENYHYGLGINFDISQYMGMQDALEKLISTSTKLEEELYSRQSINQIMNECIGSVGVPVEKMGKYDRMRIIGMLRERNVFKMQKAVPYVADRLKISRFTVYNYLKELEAQG